MGSVMEKRLWLKMAIHRISIYMEKLKTPAVMERG